MEGQDQVASAAAAKHVALRDSLPLTVHASSAPYRRNIYILSIVFFLLFTAFSSIQNLEASIIGGRCNGCDEVCWAGSDTCTDSHITSIPKASDTACKYTTPSGRSYCAKNGGKCESTCPNAPPDGWIVDVVQANATQNVTIHPEFTPCGQTGNVGSASLAVLYGMFTICCLFGPFIVQALGAKWSVVVGALLYCSQCIANLVVALYPDSVDLQWALLIPSSALIGFAASFLWTAQGAYITINANAYAAAEDLDPQAVLGTFYGIFYAFFQAAQVSGNFCAGVLLATAGWSIVTLMLFYLCFAGAATVFGFFFLQNVTDGPETDEIGADVERAEKESARSRAASVITVTRSPMEMIFGMTQMWRDRKMQLLIPTIIYNGVEQGFVWGVFTSEWVRDSVGVDNIGYVMAAFGGADVIASYGLGRVSDTTGRMPIVVLGSVCQLAVLLVLKFHDISDCDRQWAVLVVLSALWGIGDAVWNTQLSSTMGEVFPQRKEDVFSNLKLWQALSTAVVYGLDFNQTLMGLDSWLYLMFASLALGVGSYLLAYFTVGLQPVSAEEETVLTSEDATAARYTQHKQ